MNIEQALSWAKIQLAHLPNAPLEAQVLLAKVLDKPRSFVLAFEETPLTAEQSQQFENWVHRRVAGEPAAYLTGEVEFFSLRFKVTSDTLVPRADTELLVECVLDEIAAIDIPHVLDLGTGTGAIACAIAHENPAAQIMAVDACPRTLAVAQENVAQLSLDNVNVIHSDWFENVSGRFDVIVSNPPYIDEQDAHLNGDGVRFEPRGALVAKKSGLAAYEAISQVALQYLNKPGVLMFEHGFNQSEAVQTLLHQAGFVGIQTINDYAGHPRATRGRISE